VTTEGSVNALVDSVERPIMARIDTVEAQSRIRLRDASVLGLAVDLALLADALERMLDAARHLPDLDEEEVASVAESLGDVSELDGRYAVAAEVYRRARQSRAGVLDVPRLMRKAGLVHGRAGRSSAALGRWPGAFWMGRREDRTLPRSGRGRRGRGRGCG